MKYLLFWQLYKLSLISGSLKEIVPSLKRLSKLRIKKQQKNIIRHVTVHLIVNKFINDSRQAIYSTFIILG